MSQLNSIEHDGFAIASGVLNERTRLDLIRDVEGLLLECPAGVRGLAAKAPSVAALARPATIRPLVEPVLGSQARLVRSILFNKSLDANWQVAWHQDLTIAVATQEEVEGYSSWSVKEGVVHVQPPVQVLEQMLSVRLHLGPAADDVPSCGQRGAAVQRACCFTRRARLRLRRSWRAHPWAGSGGRRRSRHTWPRRTDSGSGNGSCAR